MVVISYTFFSDETGNRGETIAAAPLACLSCCRDLAAASGLSYRMTLLRGQRSTAPIAVKLRPYLAMLQSPEDARVEALAALSATNRKSQNKTGKIRSPEP
jgi:hypothetical protein